MLHTFAASGLTVEVAADHWRLISPVRDGIEPESWSAAALPLTDDSPVWGWDVASPRWSIAVGRLSAQWASNSMVDVVVMGLESQAVEGSDPTWLSMDSRVLPDGMWVAEVPVAVHILRVMGPGWAVEWTRPTRLVGPSR